MNNRQRQLKLVRAKFHTQTQFGSRKRALAEAREAIRKAKKKQSTANLSAEMEKRGYVRTYDGSFRRMTETEQQRYKSAER